jgi:multidrug efflux pump subunit AcrA (membrane-fusion protein)
MSAEPGAPAEGPQETDLVTHQALNERLELFERGFKSRLEIVRRQNEEADRKAMKETAQATVDSAIREFKRELESERLKQEAAESSKRLDRSTQWSIRFVSGVVGAGAMMVIVVAVSQCSELHERIRTLEFNQSKTK